jgi:hypothetical protein
MLKKTWTTVKDATTQNRELECFEKKKKFYFPRTYDVISCWSPWLPVSIGWKLDVRHADKDFVAG